MFRLTRLVTEDTIFDPVRERIIAYAYRREGVTELASDAATPWTDLADEDEHVPKLATLFRCMWCMGVWSALVASVARSVAPRQWRWVARMLALSAAGALVAGLEDE